MDYVFIICWFFRCPPIAHIADGLLSAPVLLTGALVTAGTLTVAAHRLDYDPIPQAAVLAADFFVASLVSAPLRARQRATAAERAHGAGAGVGCGARAFVAHGDRHTWLSLGSLMGMLLVRSLERSRRVTAAMICRGLHGRFYLLDPLRLQLADSLLTPAFVLALTGLLALEHSRSRLSGFINNPLLWTRSFRFSVLLNNSLGFMPSGTSREMGRKGVTI